MRNRPPLAGARTREDWDATADRRGRRGRERRVEEEQEVGEGVGLLQSQRRKETEEGQATNTPLKPL